VVNVSERGTTADVGKPRLRVDTHVANWREVDHEAVVNGSEPRDAVATAADCDVEPAFPAHVERHHDVARVHATYDQPRVLVDAPVVHPSRLLVLRVLRVNYVAADPSLECADEVGLACDYLRQLTPLPPPSE